MIDRNNIQVPVLLIKKDSSVTAKIYFLTVIFVVITFKIKSLCVKSIGLLTLPKLILITFDRFIRLSGRFLTQNAMRMIQFSNSQFMFEDTKTDNKADEALLCLSAGSAKSTIQLPNIH